jgi:hypothetical protein
LSSTIDANPDKIPDPAYLFDALPDKKSDPDFHLMRMRIRMRIQVTKMMMIHNSNTHIHRNDINFFVGIFRNEEASMIACQLTKLPKLSIYCLISADGSCERGLDGGILVT